MRSSSINEALQVFLPKCTFSHPIVVNVKDVDLSVSFNYNYKRICTPYIIVYLSEIFLKLAFPKFPV